MDTSAMNFSTHIAMLRRKKQTSRVFVFFFFLFSYFIFPFTFATAATLSLDPTQGSFGPGDMFVVTVRVDTQKDECINAADIALVFPNSLIKVTAISKGESLMTLWTDGPLIENEKGMVSWSGGIPGGYCGRVLGDPGKTNILGKVVFSVLSNSSLTTDQPMSVMFSSSTKVLLNDGFGSAAQLTIQNSTLTRSTVAKGVKNEWLDIVRSDTTPPDQFDVSVHHEENTLVGKYFIVFSTVDKQSGVDHFEVMEDDPARIGFVRGTNERARFQTATSPYVLIDQSLRSRVTVRAIDNAGNIEESILAPSNGAFSVSGAIDTDANSTLSLDIWWSVLVALFAVILCFAYWYHHTNKAKDVATIDIKNEDPPQTN